MGTRVPSFDIFRGFPDRDAVWVERVAGLAAARERMEQIAAEEPGTYFVFNPQSHSVLAKHASPPSYAPVTHGYNVFRKLDEGGILKVGWRHDQEQAKQLIANLMELWPAEYFIQSANTAADLGSDAPAASA